MPIFKCVDCGARILTTANLTQCPWCGDDVKEVELEV